MAYAYRRASELCLSGYDVVDRAGSQGNFYVRNGNVLQNLPKSSVSLIVTCRVQVRRAAIRHDDSAWWCTATDAGMDYCERTMAACEDSRAGMATRGVTCCITRPPLRLFADRTRDIVECRARTTFRVTARRGNAIPSTNSGG